MAGGFGVGQLTVRIGADTKGLMALTSAMLQVQRQILQSVNKMNQALESFSGKSIKVASASANAFVDGENRKQKEMEETIRKQEQLAAKQVKLAQKATAMATAQMSGMFTPFSKEMIATMSTSAQRFRTFGYLASASLTAPIVLAAKSISKLGSEFEYTMQKIVGLTGTAQSEVNAWGKDIMAIGKEFGKKPQELAEGLYFIASSGIQGAQALDVLRTSAKAAASGLGDTQSIANYLTSALNAYRGTGLDAAYATDVLVAAVREGKAEADGFASAMGSVLPIASKLGLGIDQVAGSMAAVTLTGSTAAQAATYLRGMLNGLMKGSEGGAEALETASGQIEGMAESYEDLRNILKTGGIMGLMEKLKQLQEEYGESIVSKVFPNIRAMMEVFSLTGNNMKYNNELIKRVTNSTGALGEAFNAVSDTIKLRYDRALTAANISLVELGKSVATAFLPILEKWVQRLNDLIQWFGNLSQSSKNFIFWIVKMTALLGPLSMAMSVWKYSVVGVYQAINFLGGKLGGLLQLMGAMKVVTEGTTARVLLFGKGVTKSGLAMNLLKAVKNPYVLIGAGIVAATVAVVKYRNKVIEAAEGQTEFAKATAKVNGEMKKLKELTDIDYSAMSSQELASNISSTTQKLTQAREELVKAYGASMRKKDETAEQAEKRYLNYKKSAAQEFATGIAMKGFEDPFKVLKKSSNDYIVLLEDSVIGLQNALKDMNNAMKVKADESSAEFIRKETEATEAQVAKIKEKNEAVQAIYDSLQAGLDSIDKEAAMVKDFDKVAAYLSLYENIIKQIAESKDISINTPWVQKLIADYEKLKGTVIEIDSVSNKFVDDLNADLASIKMRKFIEPSFDEIDATFEAYQKNYEKYLGLIGEQKGETKFFGMGAGVDLLAMTAIVKNASAEMEKWKKAKEMQEDVDLSNLLQAEANAYGTLASKIEVVNQSLQAQERQLKSDLKGGLDPFSDGAKRMADNIRKTRTELVMLQNQQDMQWLNDMNNALNNNTTNADLLSGRISALQNVLKVMSENGEGSTESFKILAEEMQKLTNAEAAVDILAGAFTDLFQGILEGGRNMGEILGGILKGMISQIMAALAQMLALKIIMAFINPAGALPTSKGAPTFAGLMGPPQFAKGGIVPSGFPNDTFPAMLSSGEMVLPQGVIDSISKPAIMEGEVRFEIEGDRLVGILQKQGKKSSLY